MEKPRLGVELQRLDGAVEVLVFRLRKSSDVVLSILAWIFRLYDHRSLDGDHLPGGDLARSQPHSELEEKMRREPILFCRGKAARGKRSNPHCGMKIEDSASLRRENQP